jgi:hypothetical protein
MYARFALKTRNAGLEPLPMLAKKTPTEREDMRTTHQTINLFPESLAIRPEPMVCLAQIKGNDFFIIHQGRYVLFFKKILR